MLQIMPIVIWVVCAGIGYHIAAQKGKNTTLWTVLCFLFGFIALIVLLCKKPEPGAMDAEGIQTN